MTGTPGDAQDRTAALRALDEQVAAINAHDAARLSAAYAEDAVVRDPQYPEPLRGRSAVEDDAAAFFTAFPDLRAEVTSSVVSGTELAVEMTMEGTHTGPMASPSGEVAPTGRSLRFAMAFFDTVDENGMVIDERRYYDLADQLTQLGLSG
ncbi:ester cyclase [Mycetocola sp.]|uniref:ester cyclase n=1 Tax=Mycetocola sp. TaxID=1871042 RepID=UPI003989AF6D